MAVTPIEKCTPTGKDWSIWCIPANFNYFVKTDLVPDSDEGVTNKTSNVKAHSRRLYYNDIIKVNVSAHEREFLVDPGRKVGSALPGYSFVLDDGTETRQFTTDADVVDLHAYLLGELNADTKLYTNGARYLIKPEAEGG
jgi:hypothetical protein